MDINMRRMVTTGNRERQSRVTAATPAFLVCPETQMVSLNEGNEYGTTK